MKPTRAIRIYWLFLLFFAHTTNAQTFAGSYSNQSVTLRSDVPSKSVLISDLYADRSGDISPIIGAARWSDNSKQFQCRSLLEFNFNHIPSALVKDPSLILSAELVLFPVSVANPNYDIDKPARFVVRRVLQTWEDSTTRWNNQPEADSSRQVVETIRKKKKKDAPVSMDVTRQVLDMIRLGNHGFQISYTSMADPSLAPVQWFASPKNDDDEIRPLLVITYRRLILAAPYNDRAALTAEQIQYEMDRGMHRNSPGDVAKEPVKETVAAEPAKPPVKQ